MKGENRQDAPLFYSVREVCRILQIKPHILDYWEKRFPEIRPHKIGKRNFYRKEQLTLLLQIKKLLSEGYSLEGVRKKISRSPEERSAEKSSKELSLDLATEERKSGAKTTKETVEKYRKILREVLEELREIYNSF